MEKLQNRQKQGKRKAQISFDAGNIGGLVLWGGALAVVSLIAAFSVKKNRRRKANDGDGISEKGIDNTVPENKSSTIYGEQCCESFGSAKMVEAKIDSCEERSPVSVINGQNEGSTVDSEDILNIDDPNEENTELCRDCVKDEEISLGRTGEDLQSTESADLLGEKETRGRESIQADDNSSNNSGVDLAVDIDSTNIAPHKMQLLDCKASTFTESMDNSVQEQGLKPAVNSENENATMDPDGIVISDGSIEENVESFIRSVDRVGEKEGYSESFTVDDNSLNNSVEEDIIDDVAGHIHSTNIAPHKIQPLDCKASSFTDSLDNSVPEQSLKAAVNGNSNVDPGGIDTSDDSKEEIAESCIGIEEFSLSDATLCGTGTGITNLSGEDLPVTETVDVVYEKENSYMERSSSEDNSPNQSVEDEEDISDELGCEENNGEKDRSSSEDCVIENGEEEGSEEGTISSSAESRAEAIWPAEEIEALALEHKSNVIKRENSEGKIVEDEMTTGKREQVHHFKDNQNNLVDDYEVTKNSTVMKKGDIRELGMMKDKTEHSRNWRVWASLVIGLLVLLLLLCTHRSVLSYRLFNSELSSPHEL